MEVQEIQEAIRTSRAINIPDSVIRQTLLTKHFDPVEINKAFSMLPPSDVQEHQETEQLAYEPAYAPQPEQQPAAEPAIIAGNTWYAVEQVLFFSSLFLFILSAFFTLQFNIDRWFSYDFLGLPIDMQIIAIRIFFAALLVSLPVFSYFFISVSKYPEGYIFMRIPSVIKFTFSTATILSFLGILASSVFIVFHLLNGITTEAIVLHWLVSFAISAGIFAYYLSQVMEMP